MGRPSSIRIAVVAAMALAVAMAGAPPASAAPRDEWLESAHDAGHSYANLGESQLTVAALKAIPAWPGMSRSTVDVGLLDVSAPLIKGDSMFVTSRAWDGESGRLERFDVPTEDRLWIHDLSCFGPPVVAVDWVLMEDKCTETAPTPAEMIAIGDGTVQDLAADQLGIVHRGVGYFTNDGGGVYLDPWVLTAQDVATREVLWTRKTASTQESLVPVLAAGDTLYDSHAGAIEARETATGRLRWSRTPSLKTTPLAATGDALYVRWEDGDAHGIARWDATDGHTEWRIRTPDGQTAFAFTPHAVFEAAPEFLAGRSASDGSVAWKQPKGYPYTGPGQPVFAAGVVWLRQQHGGLDAYNAGNGRHLLSEDAPPGPVTVAEGRVFVGSPDGRVFIYELPS